MQLEIRKVPRDAQTVYVEIVHIFPGQRLDKLLDGRSDPGISDSEDAERIVLTRQIRDVTADVGIL